MRHMLATACDLKYAPGAEALLISVRRHHPDVTRYCFAPPAETEAVARALGDLATVVPVPRPVRGVPDRLQPAVFRLFVPHLPADVAVWADCDIVLTRPVPEFWQVAPGEVVAVTDTADEVRSMVEPPLQPFYENQFPAVVGRKGFNSGLFGLRPADWADLPERYEAAFAAGGYPHHPKIWDQPFLNGLMYPRVRHLPRTFNAHSLFDQTIPWGVRAVHFTSTPKPWQPGYPRHEPAYYYWLRYGEGEGRLWPLARAKIRIWARTPQRLLGRWLRRRGLR